MPVIDLFKNSEKLQNLKLYLDYQVEIYNQVGFVASDPIAIPHGYTQIQDIEIMGLLAATLAWGQRPVILKKCSLLAGLMDNVPYDFIRSSSEWEWNRFEHFCHRTFNATDLYAFMRFFRGHYQQYYSLEDAFVGIHNSRPHTSVEQMLNGFKSYFFEISPALPRTGKHVSAPQNKSACKRLNMFLRWMCRKDDKGVDFGLWQKISPAILICPLDLHSYRSAHALGLLSRTIPDWKAAIELTENLKLFDINDPVRYDFALFGMGVGKKIVLGSWE